MKQRLLTLALMAGCIVFGVIGFLVYAGQDHSAPEIKVEKESISYTEGESYENLMKGVTAKDNINGDLTDEVFVDKIVPTEKGKAIVYYGVLDKHNNVGTARRKISYTASETDESEEMQKEEAVEEDMKDADTSTTDEEEAEESEALEDKEEDEELKPDGKKPAMALTSEEMTIKKGTSFDVLSVVKGVVDDKDDKNTLYQHIHADGKYDTKKKGTYSIRYYVSDSDGNTSEPHTFTLKVE